MLIWSKSFILWDPLRIVGLNTYSPADTYHTCYFMIGIVLAVTWILLLQLYLVLIKSKATVRGSIGIQLPQ